MTMEAIVLAGGRGTRLASVIRDVQKALAPVGNQPFLELLLLRLKQSGFTRVILSVGYLHGMIREHFGSLFEGVELTYAGEEEPLGTGGATLRALRLGHSSPVFVLNGDTLVDLDFDAMLSRHVAREASVSLAVAEMAAVDYRDFKKWRKGPPTPTVPGGLPDSSIKAKRIAVLLRYDEPSQKLKPKANPWVVSPL